MGYSIEELKALVVDLILSGGRRTTALNVREVLDKSIESFLNNEDGGFVVQKVAGYETLLDLSASDNKAFVHKKYVLDLFDAATSFLFFTNIASFPLTGIANKVYVAQDTLFGYLWTGFAYELFIYRLSDSDQLAEGAVNKYYTSAESVLNEKLANKGVANGYAGLDGSGKVPAAQLPSYVDDVIEAADFSTLPPIGEAGKIYITLDNNKVFRWTGSVYVEIVASPGSTDAVPEGATNKYFTESRVRATVMTGIDLATGGTGLATDSLLVLLGKTYANIMNHISNTNNPHGTTKSQVGLGNADNTSDANKPVSTATQTALNLKLDISAVASTVLAIVLTGFSVPASSAVVATDTILQAFGKIQAQLNGKATINGDAPAGTWRVGTTNAQSAAVRTNGVDRLTVDASGNIVQAGSTTTFDIVIMRIRNTTGAFFDALSVTVAGILNIGTGATEIQFMKPITNIKGTGSRIVEASSIGDMTATEEIIPLKIFNLTVQGLLSAATNWAADNTYSGASLASYGLYQGQYYVDSLYEYCMDSTTVPIRKPRHRVARRLTNTYASTKNIGAGLTTLIDYTLPASTLNKNGDAVEFNIEGAFITPTNGSFEIIVGGTPMFAKYGVSVSCFVKVVIKLVRTASNVQTLYLEGKSASGTTVEIGYTNTAFTDTAGINVLVKGQDTASDKVEVKLFEVDFKPCV